MTDPHFRLISEEEFNDLPFEQRMAYLHQLMHHLNQRAQDTGRPVEQSDAGA